MAEFKIDAGTGVPKLLELNGRFWGSLPLAVAAGVDFPYLFYRLASGEPAPRCLSYREGVVSRHLVSDIKHLLAVLFDSNPMRPYTYPSRPRAIMDFLLPPRGCRYDVMDAADLKPVLAEAFDTVSRLAGLRPRQ
jgi:hypothetical protein